MFESDRLIYLQLQKTGGTHIAKVLEAVLGGNVVSKHGRLSPEHLEKYIVGSIRNPWDWYVSLWAYGCGGQGNVFNTLTKSSLQLASATVLQGPTSVRRTIWRINAVMSQHVRRRHRSIWREVYSDPDSPENFRQWIRMLFGEEYSSDLPDGYGSFHARQEIGFYTFRLLRLFMLRSEWAKFLSAQFSSEKVAKLLEGSLAVDGYIRLEKCQEDVPRELEKAGYRLDLSQRQMLKDLLSERSNSSIRRTAEYYYDQETRDYVQRGDHFIIERFGYSADDLVGLR